MLSIIIGATMLLLGWTSYFCGNFELGVMLALSGIGFWIIEIGKQTA